jgi:hypothetical protein
MGAKRANQRDWVAGRLADRQHGVVSRAQLLAAGLSRRTIGSAIAAGRLRPLFNGVYAVGHVATSHHGWCQAALLACGEESTLSHGTACRLWDLRRAETFPLSVIVPNARGRKHDRIDLHRSRLHRSRLHRSEWMLLDGLRVTTPARTIVDMAGELGPKEMRRLVERAQDLRRFKPNEVRAILNRHLRQPGRRGLLDFIALLEPDADGARSYLERMFLPLIRTAGLPRPEVNVRIEGRERDFVWRERQLVIEVDGYAYHSSRTAIRRDKARDRRLTAARWRPARFTYAVVAFEPAATAAELTKLG